MANRQITDLPVATVANDADILLLRQGLFDKQVEVGIVRSGFLKASNNLSDVADPAIARTNLGINTANFLLSANNLSDVANPATARTNLGIDLTLYLTRANNLSDLMNPATAVFNLGLPSAANIAVKNATNDYAFNIQQRQQLQNYSELRTANGNISGVFNFNVSLGNVHSAIVSGNATLGFQNAASSGQASSVQLFLSNGGAFTTGWASSVKWPGGTAPTLTTSGLDLLVFTTIDGGTTWYGMLAGKDLK